MSTHEEMGRLLREIEEALPEAAWEAQTPFDTHGQVPLDMHVYEGTTPDGWHFLVTDFGFSPDSRGYDGCARKGATIIRFTREIAEKAYALALTSNRKRATNNPPNKE